MSTVESNLNGVLKKQQRAMRDVLLLLSTAHKPGELEGNAKKAEEILRKTLGVIDAAKADVLLRQESLDGSEWGELLLALVAKHGKHAFRRDAHRGKQGCIDYLSAARDHAVDGLLSNSGRTRYNDLIKSIDADVLQVRRLLDVSERERIAAGQHSDLTKNQ